MIPLGRGVTVLSTTSGEPTILTPDGASLYEQFARSADRPGETTTITQESYEHPAEAVVTTDPDELEAMLRAPTQVDTDTKVADAALALITESPADPKCEQRCWVSSPTSISPWSTRPKTP